MTKKRGKERRRARAAALPRRPRARTLELAVALAAVHGAWAIFQWSELLVARGGGEAFCALGGGEACTEVWDSPFANAVQRFTFVPVAGWGVVWSLVALALPLWARLRMRRARPAASAWPATLVTAFAGALAVVTLAAASVTFGTICTNCVVTYLIVLAYAAACVRDLEPLGRGELRRGLGVAAAATAAAFLLLLYPGTRTPAARSAPELASIRTLVPPPEGAEADRLLASYLRDRPSPVLDLLSASVAEYARGLAKPLRPPRSLFGPPEARVRITEFSDILCSHCATFHDTLKSLRRALPPGSFSVELRHFPLDGACNPNIQARHETPVRCTGAKAIICSEGKPYQFDLAGVILENQRGLTEERVYALAERYVPRGDLAACIADPATEAKLQDDIAYAMEYDPPGTPLVLLNGRMAPVFPPFLDSIVLAGGNASHPFFAHLPPVEPRPSHTH